jgi:micrococcal nuclease
MRRLARQIVLCLLVVFFSTIAFAQDIGSVVKVLDGDTIQVQKREGQIVTVRLIGVDTPETVHPQKPAERFGREASSFTMKLLLASAVRLEYDPDPTQRVDKYGRTLAYVFRDSDGLFVNREIIAQGYGHAYTLYPFKYLEGFRAAENEAREGGLGLWAGESESAAVPTARVAPAAVRATSTRTESSGATETVYVTKTGSKYHREGCRYLARSQIPTPLKDASARYGACSVCNPPAYSPPTKATQIAPTPQTAESESDSETKTQTVYITKTGTKYHRTGCQYLSKSAIPISLNDAQAGYSACSRCQPPTRSTSETSVTAPAATSPPAATPSATSSSSSDRVYVRGYYRKDGTYVKPHTRSKPGSKSKARRP